MEHFKNPFASSDLATARAVENQAFFDQLSQRVMAHGFLSHPFVVQAHTMQPSREFTSHVLTCFYDVVRPFTSMLCLLAGHAPDLRSRFAIMDNMYEEMGCGNWSQAHPNLYAKMLTSIGVDPEAPRVGAVSPAVRRINQHLRDTIEHEPFSVACAVFAAAEMIIPDSFPALSTLTRRAFPEVDMTFFDRHGPRDAGHSDDAAMLFAINAERADHAIVDREVDLHLNLRTALFDEWMSAIPRRRVSERPRPVSVRPSAYQSVPPPA